MTMTEERMSTVPAARRQGSPAQAMRLAVTVTALLAAHNVLLNMYAPASVHLPLSLAVAAGLVFIGRFAGLSWDQLGLGDLRHGRPRRGWRLAAGIAAAIAVIAAVPASRSLLADSRFIDVSAAAAAFKVLVEIPLTVGFEEVAFRGVLLGCLLRALTTRGAVVASAALFGLWHILPTLDLVQTVELEISTAVVFGAVIAATAAAGLVFAWLRVRDQHVLSPLLVHGSLNAVAYVAGWTIVRWQL